MTALSTYWVTLYNLRDFLIFFQTAHSETGAFFVKTAGVCFTWHTNRIFLCLTYLFIGCLSPYTSWGKAKQTWPGGRKEYPSKKNSSTPHYPFHSQTEDREKKNRPETVCSQKQLSGVEQWRLIQRGNAPMAMHFKRVQDIVSSFPTSFTNVYKRKDSQSFLIIKKSTRSQAFNATHWNSPGQAEDKNMTGRTLKNSWWKNVSSSSHSTPNQKYSQLDENTHLTQTISCCLQTLVN